MVIKLKDEKKKGISNSVIKGASAEIRKKGKKKVINVEKRIYKPYMNRDEMVEVEKYIEPSKLTYGLIDSSEVVGIVNSGEKIEIAGSWEGLILFMLDAINSSVKDFIRELSDSEITFSEFSVGKEAGKYSQEVEYKAYNLYDTGYIVESDFSVETIYRVVNNCNALISRLNRNSRRGNNSEEGIQLIIRNKRSSEELRLMGLSEETYEVGIDKLIDEISRGGVLMNLRIYDVNAQVTNALTLIYSFSVLIYERFGVEGLQKITGTAGSGIRKAEENGEGEGVAIKDSGYEIYSDCLIVTIVKFIESSIEALKIDKSEVRFSFKLRKEWDIV